MSSSSRRSRIEAAMSRASWRRLALIGLAVVVVLGWLPEARFSEAQPTRDTRRIGMLRSVSSEPPDAPHIRANLAALWRGLGEHGYAEGLNARVEYRLPKGDPTTLAELRDL